MRMFAKTRVQKVKILPSYEIFCNDTINSKISEISHLLDCTRGYMYLLGGFIKKLN